MPWWSWILIWVGLVLILIAMLVLIARWLYRKLLALEAELSRLQSLLDELEARADALVTETELARPAVVRDRDEVVAEHRALRRTVDARKADRRAKRVQHGRLLVTDDPQKYAFLARRK